MKLIYKILWFEDDLDLIEDYQEEVEKHLKSLGFTPIIIHETNGEKLEDLLKQDFDLILTDLNLGEHETGQILIERIRSNQIYTEVLFYSGNQYEINNIMQKEKWVERISVSVGIENLLPKVRDLINLTVKKFQDVNAMRGLLMAETSELDIIMVEVIKKILQSIGDATSIEDNIQILLNKTIKNRTDKLDELQALNPSKIDQIIDELTSYDKMCAIQRLLKVKNRDSEKNFISNATTLNSYNIEIIKKRNILAHAKETIFFDGNKIIKSELTGEEILINDDFCTRIRIDIKKHKQNFEELLYKLPSEVLS